MTKDEFIGKMQMAYFGNRNALEECTQEYIKTRALFEKALEDNIQTTIKKMTLEQALDEIEKYMTNYIKVEDKNENVKVEFNELLKIIQETKGDIKNENNNI